MPVESKAKRPKDGRFQGDMGRPLPLQFRTIASIDDLGLLEHPVGDGADEHTGCSFGIHATLLG